MAVRLLAYEVADLCLGKPPLKSLSVVSSTVGDALAALRSCDDSYISVWSCDHSSPSESQDSCKCIGKVCMVDVIIYLCRQENLSTPSSAIKSPLSLLISNVPGLVRHVDPSSSLLEAIDLILQGTQNLVVPIRGNITSNAKRKQVLNLKPSISPTAHNGLEFCWLTQEDVIRFILSTVGLFLPIPALSIDTLDIISTEFMTIGYHSLASDALGAISSSLAEQTSVAVVDNYGLLIGEISPFALTCCDETVAAAIMTLSAGDLLSYIDCGGPPEDIIRIVRERLKERNLEGLLEEYNSDIPSSPSSNSSFSDEELVPLTLSKGRRHSRSSSYSARMVRRAEAIVCHPWSSLVAVMVQAIAHRVNYVWVIEDDCSLVGIVTFSNILGVFGEHLQLMAQ
ncbi:hypothetical protein LguiA_035523 [Lonicera macranthoides]